MNSYFDDIVDFHKRFGLDQNEPKVTVGSSPTDGISEQEWKLRHDRLSEEMEEYFTAVDEKNDVETLDALVDICYIAIGTAYRRGWDFNEAWRRVHESNMMKERGTARTSKYGSSLDIVKPQGWTPPNLTDLVK